MLAVAALGLTACTDGGTATGPGESATIDGGIAERIDTAVQTALEQSRSTGAIVGVWTDSAGDYVRGYGEGVDANVQFRAGQASQPVVCALLLDFAAEGTLKLGREVSKDLARQVGIDGVTYEQLCNGTSGLADFKANISDIFVNNPARPWTDRELLTQALPNSPLPWPGRDVYISDTNALLLGHALSIETRESLSTLLSTRVFEPAGMTSSTFPDPSSTNAPAGVLLGKAFPSSGGQPVCEVDPIAMNDVSSTMLSGAGATLTTVSDLKTFYTKYLDGGFGGELGKVVTETLPTANPERDANGEPVNPAAEVDPNAQQFGFGVEKQGPLFGRSGSMPGTITAAYRDPASNFTVVVTLNNSSAGAAFARALAFELAAIAGEAGATTAMPWTAEDQAAALAAAAICPLPVEEPAPEAPVEEAPAEG